MPPKHNPLKLNPLQLKTLTLLQAVREIVGEPLDGGAFRLGRLPHAHGDHFHVGSAAVSGRDATGLTNQAVWVALERKGLIADPMFPHAVTLTAVGNDYNTGLADSILHRSDH